ncbi:virulence RhuM family protein [Parapedobacter tibetensis]|uniref:virulence RhuM family protein n=1 Tax=Parapedobacter tibetensis TaxID=2972951 RepID=UPI00214D25AA|nr:virulence RhuM family protein [Parapedobacter tibetensis]
MTENQIEIYQSSDGQTLVEVKFEHDTIWLNQKQMAELFGKDTDTIGLHLRNIFKEKELEEKSTTEVFSVVQTEGKRQIRRNVQFYNLDAIISVGYRVNSKRGTQFRIWATQRLREYLVQGYAINEKRLAQKQHCYPCPYYRPGTAARTGAGHSSMT